VRSIASASHTRSTRAVCTLMLHCTRRLSSAAPCHARAAEAVCPPMVHCMHELSDRKHQRQRRVAHLTVIMFSATMWGCWLTPSSNPGTGQCTCRGCVMPT
jgi:hypothetical protein